MAAVLNPSFETAGASAGLAANWTLTIAFTGWTIGEFSGGSGPLLSLESFDSGWGTSPFAFLVAGGTASIFDVGAGPDPGPLESFSFWSGNAYYRTQIVGGLSGDLTGGGSLESFETLWSLTGGSLATVVSGGVTFSESFEPGGSGWGNDVYDTVVSGGAVASFNGGGLTLESFETLQPDVVFAIPDYTTNKLVTLTPHGLPNGRAMTIDSTGTPPPPLQRNVTYYVVSTASLDLKLSLTFGGAAIALTGAGTGEHLLHADETLFWTDAP